MRRYLIFLLVVLIMSCSPEKPSGQNPAGGQGAVSESSQAGPRSSSPYSLEVVPVDATRKSILYVNATGFNLAEAQVEWLVNGSPVAFQASNQFNAAEVKKGDKVQAKAVFQGTEIFSNTIQIKNAQPEIKSAIIIPETGAVGSTLRVEATGSDADGDDVSFTYEWMKNNERVSDTARLDVLVNRGDKIIVKITPSDGEAYGRPVVVEREMMNAPPRIIEDRNFKYTFDGNVYSYQVKAMDPDGDQLVYSLKSGPPGMTINPATGLVQWNVPADFKGKAPFTVAVSDGHDETTQDLSVEIKSEAKK